MARSIASHTAPALAVNRVAFVGLHATRAVVVAASILGLTPDVAFGQARPVSERIASCSACHGEDGNSRLANVPSLAGQPEFFLLNQLVLMRDGVRMIPAMMPLVRDLSDADIQAIASHFAAREARPSGEPIDASLAMRGRELAKTLRCGSCHLMNLEGRQQIPRLARQRIDYLAGALKEYRDGTRAGADTLMNNAVAGVSDADLDALAHHATAPQQ
jgi:cytochrome c553